MFIQLKTKGESDKAWQLCNGCWIPKSILDGAGLKPPYYKVKDWWISKVYKKFYNGDKESTNILMALQDMRLKNLRELPKDVLDHWNKYWKENYENSGYSHYDMEPRMWGNDCFEGNMSDYH